MKSISNDPSQEGLYAVLHQVRATLQRENDTQDGAIRDTIWHTDAQTLFDYLDTALQEFKPEKTANDSLMWAVCQWNAQVANRPLANIYRSTLDTVWRQVMRRFGGDPGKLIDTPIAEIKAALPNQPEQPRWHIPLWRCFHCDETFVSKDAAAEHFGTSLMQEPACLIDIEKFRRMEAQTLRYLEEDTDLHREIARIQCENQTAVRRAEEAGYARGLEESPDKQRMDALERLVLNVRLDLRYGSKDLFWATPEDLDGDTGPSDIRAKMDALIAGRVLETTVEPKDIVRDLSAMIRRLIVAIRSHAPKDSPLAHIGNLAWALLHDRGLSGNITRDTNT